MTAYPSETESIREFAARALAAWSPVVVSNRAPYEAGPRGSMRKGAGGLVTALLTVADATGADWVCCARTPVEREKGQSGDPVVVPGRVAPMRIHYAVPEPEEYRRYYSVISNPLLWFLQHYLWDLTYEPVITERTWQAWRDGYLRVNQLMAERVIALARDLERPPLVLTQDYQLYLAPRYVRQALPEATLQQFIHIPWPTPNYWKVIPHQMRHAILDGLLANDVIGFQSSVDERNFLLSCEELLGLRVDHRDRVVLHDGRAVWVRHYPISVDLPGLRQQAASDGVEKELGDLRAGRPRRLIARVDRTDPSKNIVRGFLAYERLLRRHREWVGQVQFYAFLQPSRQDVTAYRDYLEEIKRTAERINRAFGTRGWRPIRLELAESFSRALALYRDFDVLLVNPIYDGMNLVAKEGMLLNERTGALVLSENAGAFEELGEFAYPVNPFDVDATAEALQAALTAPAAERQERAEAVRRVVAAHDIGRWLVDQVEDVRDLAPRAGGEIV
ncbi:MAG: alpha,alpha-trehalose-phosphate synthase (UDP-forming) [Candidatus Dormibacteraceae bacterium]